jgi:hypothetical protein
MLDRLQFVARDIALGRDVDQPGEEPAYRAGGAGLDVDLVARGVAGDRDRRGERLEPADEDLVVEPDRRLWNRVLRTGRHRRAQQPAKDDEAW